MAAVHWSPNLSVGDEAIDADHENLIDLLNAFTSNVEARAGRQTVTESLDLLIEATARHFRHEEQIMARENYPELDHHRRLHDVLMQEIRELRGDLKAGMEIGTEVPDFIRNWLISHILESDKQLGGYLMGRRTRRLG